MGSPDGKNRKHVLPCAIRELTTNDIVQYDTLLRYAFQLTEQDLMQAGWHADEIRQSKFPVLERADVLGCYDGEKLVSQCAVYPLDMNVHGATYPIGFITSVSTYPEYSGKGIMSRLLKKSLTRMREKRQSLALLYPYSIPLYRKFGWEIISNKISYSIKGGQFSAKAGTPGHVRRVGWENEDFMNLHTQFARQTHGCLFRNFLAWEEYWRWTVDDTVVAIYYSAEDKPLGYMVYLIRDDVMYIKEMIYCNWEAQKGLWEYIQAHDSMIDEIKGNTYFNEPVAFNMHDGEVKETIRPYIMGRIVDVEEFFSQYRCDSTESDVRIAFEISDTVFEWNNRVVTVLFHKGQCSLTDQRAEYRAAMDIATLTTLLMGYKTAAQLCRIERIQGDERSVRRLDDVLLHETPYISDFI